MESVDTTEKVAINAIRTALGVSGAVALIVGMLILVWPAKTAVVVAVIIGIYALIAGLVYAGMAIFSKSMKGWSRVGHLLLGVLYLIAGIVVLANLSAATAWLGILVGIAVGAMWIVEGVVSLTLLGQSSNKALTVVFAVLSIIAGIVLLFSPLWGAVVLWWLLGLSLVVLGITQIVRAFGFGRETAPERSV